MRGVEHGPPRYACLHGYQLRGNAAGAVKTYELEMR
jgi:hypothetical protein